MTNMAILIIILLVIITSFTILIIILKKKEKEEENNLLNDIKNKVLKSVNNTIDKVLNNSPNKVSTTINNTIDKVLNNSKSTSVINKKELPPQKFSYLRPDEPKFGYISTNNKKTANLCNDHVLYPFYGGGVEYGFKIPKNCPCAQFLQSP